MLQSRSSNNFLVAGLVDKDSAKCFNNIVVLGDPFGPGGGVIVGKIIVVISVNPNNFSFVNITVLFESLCARG